MFGELLQRVPWLGKASTPHLQVAPVFAMQGAPKTPVTGQRYNSPTKAGSATTRLELQALFQVIGERNAALTAAACLQRCATPPRALAAGSLS